MSTPNADRRRFLKLMGLAGATAAIAATPLALAAQPGVSRRTTTRTPKPPPAPAPPAATTPPSPPPDVVAEAKALASIVEARYGKHLDAAQLEAVTRELEFRIQAGRALRAAKLANHDEPDSVFRA